MGERNSTVRWLQTFPVIISVVLIIVTAAIAMAAQSVLGQLAAPIPLLPADSDVVVVPTFSWMALSGADHYEVQVGPQADPNDVYWSATTYNLNLTPNDASKFPNEGLYWRVRAYDSGGTPGTWSDRVYFSKTIPAPDPRSPVNHLAVAEPALEWDPVQGAAYYTVEVTRDPSFNAVDYTYTTYNTHLTPQDAIEHGTFYWRVTGVDADGHVGTPSVARVFVKTTAAPIPLAPSDGMTVTEPTLSWRAVEGAASYKVEVTQDPTFNSVDYTYTTYNTHLTPQDAIEHGTFYWRVTGIDADGNAGTPGETWSFVKVLPAPVLVAPGDGVEITIPTLQWEMVAGAARYKVEITSDPNFAAVDKTYTTYDTRLTPVDALAAGTYYWRVRGVDADDHEGAAATPRSFTLNALPAATDAVPQLQSPAPGAVLTADPAFRWSRVVGAETYRLRVSTTPDFSGTTDAVVVDYTAYTPYTPGLKDTYVNGTYYWKVEARNSSGVVIATSEVYSFTKAAKVLLSGPADSALLERDPTFRWEPVVGAKTYRLQVSTSPDFSGTTDAVVVDYTAYTPYTPGLKDTYVNGTYYWKVEARNSSGVVIATSEARSFTKAAKVLLSGPSDGSVLERDPTFRWEPVVGAKTYRLRVSTSPDFSGTTDAVVVDYTAYTPYTSGLKDTYVNGTYYWKVEARNSSGVVIATSEARSFTKTTSIPLYDPPDQVTSGNTPTFRWGAVVGAKTYRLRVSTSPGFNTTYDSVVTDYTTYTPYSAGLKDTYAEGTYYWKVEARNGNTVIATSQTRVFTVSSVQPTSTPIGAPTATPTPSPSATPVPTATPGPGPTPTPPGTYPPAGPSPSSKKSLGSVTVYADTFTDLGDNVWQAEGHVRLGSSATAYAELSLGTVTLDYNAQSITGSGDSALALLLDDGSAAPLFTGSFAVDPSTGDVTPLGVVYRLARLGDLGVDTATPLVDFALDVLQGTVSGRARITVYPIEGVYTPAWVGFTLHHDGHVSGDLGLGDLTFQAAGVTFSVEDATLSYDPGQGGCITIAQASVRLPEALSLGAEGEVQNLVITKQGLQRVGGGTITLSLPDMSVPGTGGKFELAGASVTMSLAAGGKYRIHGRADFSLPNIASTGEVGKSYSGSLYAEFELDQDGLRYVLMGGEIEPGIPIGESGMALTGMEGSVTLRPEVRVQVTGTIESELEVPPLGPVVSGEPSIWVKLNRPYEVGISGSVQVLIFDAANASLVLSQNDGLSGDVHITYVPYALEGDASLHVWRDGDEFHFTGSATVTLGFEKGALGTYWGVDLPPSDLTFGSVSAEFGEFCHNAACTSSVYGFKGAVDLTISVHVPLDGTVTKNLFSYAFFLDVNGNLDYGDSLDQYTLVDQTTMQAQRVAAGLLPTTKQDEVTFEVADTDLLMAGLEWKAGDPTLTLVDPDGDQVTTTVAYAGMGYTTTATSLLYVIDAPKPGTWHAVIGNLNGDEEYNFGALGRNAPPAVTVESLTKVGDNRYEVHWSAHDDDADATLALYYDDNAAGADGVLIAKGLDPSLGHYTWDASAVKTGDYYVYARMDDLKNVPAVSYASTPVSVVNTVPPSAPTNLQAEVLPPWRRMTVCWDRSVEPDVVGYYVYYGTRPGTYDLGRYDATNVDCYSLPVPPWMKTGYVSVVAYDNSGNESDLSPELTVPIVRTYFVYLPLTLKLSRP